LKAVMKVASLVILMVVVRVTKKAEMRVE
jgi:hypothetical protein